MSTTEKWYDRDITTDPKLFKVETLIWVNTKKIRKAVPHHGRPGNP